MLATSSSPSTSGLAIFEGFRINGAAEYEIQPYDTAIEEQRPRILDECSQEGNLHKLLFAANSRAAKPEARPFTEPLRGFLARQKVKVDKLAPAVLRTAELASIEKDKNPGDPTDTFIFETAAEWVYRMAVPSLAFLTGIEGCLALLNSPGISSVDKSMLSADVYRNYPPLINWERLAPRELDLLLEAMKERALSEYAMSIARPLFWRRDPRVIPLLEQRANDPSLSEYHRTEAKNTLARIQQNP